MVAHAHNPILPAAMNCPSRTDPACPEGWNQNPNAMNADATTNADFDHMANAKLQRNHRIDATGVTLDAIEPSERDTYQRPDRTKAFDGRHDAVAGSPRGNHGRASGSWRPKTPAFVGGVTRVFLKYAKFIGPGFMVSVAYIDPGRDAFTTIYLPLSLMLCPR
jgi:metal iron transporter